MSITTTIDSNVLGSTPTITYAHADGGHVNATVSNGSLDFIGSDIVDFDVAVPGNVDLDLHTSVGDIDVINVRGQLHAQNNTGSISVAQTTLMGSGSLETNTGSITFNGAIATHANYHLESNVGQVDVTLPANSAFHIDAVTGLGSISNDFPAVHVVNKFPHGSEAHGSVGGNNPSVMLSLQTDTGSIGIHKA